MDTPSLLRLTVNIFMENGKMSRMESHLWDLVIFLSFILGLWGSLAIIKIVHSWSQHV